MMKYQCKCCGYYTLNDEPLDPERFPGTFEICPVCYWEDDSLQFLDPDYEGEANKVSLNQAKENFKKYNASRKDVVCYVRKPRQDEIGKG